MVELLFDQELAAVVGAGQKERLNQKHLDQLRRVAARAPEPDSIDRQTSRTAAQYYKDERLLTLYGFEAIHHGAGGQGASPWAWRELMLLAFDGRFPEPESFQFPVSIKYEQEVPESRAFRSYVKQAFDDGAGHPVLYIRRWAAPKLHRPKAAWEGPTQVDTVAVWDHKLDRQRLYVEAKFTSDISKDVTYCSTRNQIARSIEAGLVDTSRAMGLEEEITPEVIERFWFLLVTPRLYKVERPQSRLYGFLMAEYMDDPTSLRRDLGHLGLDDDAWAAISSRIGWATWEDFRRVAEAKAAKDHPSIDPIQLPGQTLQDLAQFWEDRLVRVPPLVGIHLRSDTRVGSVRDTVQVEDVGELQARLRRRGAKRVCLAQTNRLTGDARYEPENLRVKDLDGSHIEWLLGDEDRFLDY